MSGKTNPRRQPRTQADVDKARDVGFQKGMTEALLLMLYVLMDKYNATAEDLKKFNDAFQDACDCVNGGYVKMEDVARVLADEYGVTLDLK